MTNILLKSFEIYLSYLMLQFYKEYGSMILGSNSWG